MHWISQFLSLHDAPSDLPSVAGPKDVYIVLQLRFHLFAFGNIDIHARKARPPTLLIAFEAADTRQPSLSARRVLNAKFHIPIGAGFVQLPYRIGDTLAVLFDDALEPNFEIESVAIAKTVQIVIGGREIHFVTGKIKIPYPGRDDLLCQRQAV